ncbi:MAG: DUF4276 family protein [Flavobacteriales bacterium]|nr:MAG: DUF4276 family protein [Flavobacteriales bacterium]
MESIGKNLDLVMSKIKSIGIIAEDLSDIEASKLLIKRIIQKDRMPFKHYTGDGCGKIMRKALDWSNLLHQRGCDLLVLIHDLDRNHLLKLKGDLQAVLKSSKMQNKLICIPTEEMEAWFLSDMDGLRTAMSLKRTPKAFTNPENVPSPKEKLGEIVYLCSNKERSYLNTKHNSKLALSLSIDLMKTKCPSFNELHQYLTAQTYK